MHATPSLMYVHTQLLDNTFDRMAYTSELPAASVFPQQLSTTRMRDDACDSLASLGVRHDTLVLAFVSLTSLAALDSLCVHIA